MNDANTPWRLAASHASATYEGEAPPRRRTLREALDFRLDEILTAAAGPMSRSPEDIAWIQQASMTVYAHRERLVDEAERRLTAVIKKIVASPDGDSGNTSRPGGGDEMADDVASDLAGIIGSIPWPAGTIDFADGPDFRLAYLETEFLCGFAEPAVRPNRPAYLRTVGGGTALSVAGRLLLAAYSWQSIPEDKRDLSLRIALRRLDRHALKDAAPGNPGGYERRTVVDDAPIFDSTLARIGHLYLQHLSPEALARRAALQVLTDVNMTGDATAARELERAVLDRMTLHPLPTFDAAMGIGDDVNGVYPLDEKLAVILEGVGDGGRALASEVRTTASAQPDVPRFRKGLRWVLGEEPMRVPRLLAKALWVDVVKGLIGRLTHSHPALARVVHTDVIGLLRPGRTYRDGFILDEDGRQQTIFRRSVALNVPAVEMGAIPRLLSKGVELLGSKQAHSIVRHFVFEGHRRLMAGEPDARVLRFTGGWSALASDASVNHGEDARAIVIALAHAPHELPDGAHGNLLSYTWKPHAPGRPALLSVVLGDMLLPHYVYAIAGKTRSRAEARHLVPVVDFPPLHGRPNEHGAQLTLQMTFMARLRAGAVELANTGTVRIPDSEMAEMARDSGLPAKLLPEVLARWEEGKGDKPPFIVRNGDRYTLAPAFAVALDFMAAAGRASIAASKAGKLSAARVPGQRRPRRTAP